MAAPSVRDRNADAPRWPVAFALPRFPAIRVRPRTDKDQPPCNAEFMSDVGTPSRAALHDRAPTNPSSAEGPVLLIVGKHDLNHLAMYFVASRRGARTIRGAQADVLSIVCRTAVDLILLDVDASLMAGFVLAAHIRAADRARDDGKSAVILATTSSQGKFRECLAGASAIEGVLKMPCDLTLFAAFVDRWCHVHDFKAEHTNPAGTTST